MWPLIRTALQRPQIIVVLAVLFLVADALLSMFSPESAAAHPDRPHPESFPGTEIRSSCHRITRSPAGLTFSVQQPPALE